MPFRGSTLVWMYAAANHALSGPGFPFGCWNRRDAWAQANTTLLAAYPSLRAEDLVNAWSYAGSHSAEIEAQIRGNEAA